jgi:hypothetical protein
MKTMAVDTSATMREETPHANQTTRTKTILNALTRRAQARLDDPWLDPQSRAILRYALETHDPWLARLVRQADAGERIVDTFDFPQTSEPVGRPSGSESRTSDSNEVCSNEEKIEALAEIICQAGDEPETKSAALLVLMGMLENSTDPKVLANAAKHFAFTRCGEFNLYGMVDAQIGVIESELLTRDRPAS